MEKHKDSKQEEMPGKWSGAKLATLLFSVFTFFSMLDVRAENALYYNYAGGTANYGAETHIEKTGQYQRILVYQGTVNINEGAYVKVGGDGGGSCNFIGIDQNSPGAMNINGGTVWCTMSGGGAGILGVGNSSRNVTSTLTLNRGTLKVETQLRSSTAYNGLTGCTSSGTITINGGEAEVKQFVLGANSSSTGTSTLILNGGRLTVEELNFQPYNGQAFTWNNGCLAAARDNVFTLATYEGSKTRTMQITGAPASFDTAGYAQSIPAFTGTGRLRLTGGGAVTFEQETLSYGLIFDGANVNLGVLDAGTARLTTPNLEIIGPTTLNVMLPASPSGRYPLIACTSSLDGSLGQVVVSGGGAGVLIRDGKTLYLSFDAADADAALVYSAAAGGADTPALASYTRLAFTDAAGAFTVGGDGLAFSQDISDASAVPQAVTAPVTLSTANSSIYVAAGGRLTLSGGLTATSPRKDGPGTLVLDSATMPSTIVPREGVLDFGGNTLTGNLVFSSRRYHGEEITLTNGTWHLTASLEWQGSSITVADGFTVDFAANDKRVAIGYLGVNGDEAATTQLIVDGGTVKTAGNKSDRCNFVAVDRWGTATLEVRRGTFHANGANASIRIGVNDRPHQTGIVRVRGGLFKIDNDLSLATRFDGLIAQTGKGIFELSGGTADVQNFYLGAETTSTGRGEVHLTGGVLEVGSLKCLARSTQTFTADGATIRAKRNDSASAPFMTALASEDAYPKIYTLGAGGLTVDTAGYNVRCDIPWSGTGGLTVTGAGGSLAIGGARSFAGDLVVSNGVTVVFSGSQTFTGRVVLGGADAKLRFDTTSYQEDTLTFATGGFTLPDGVDDVLDLVEIVGDGYVVSVNEAGDTITLSLPVDVAAYAWWTGAGDPADFADPANWACTNSVGGGLANALPDKATVVVIPDVNTFAVPSGTVPGWAATQVGNGGAIALGTDGDWSALPNVTIVTGSYIDLCGHNLKISNLTAAEGYDGAYVTNSVAGTKPALWAEDAFAETDYIDTTKVRVCTDCLEVKSVNGKTFAATGKDLAATMDATVVVTGGVMSVALLDATRLGSNDHTATLCLSNNATAQFHDLRVGFNGTSCGKIVVSDNATLRFTNFMTLGHHNGSECIFVQDGGTVNSAADLNVGVGNSATSRYEMVAGTLSVGGNFVPGRGETTGGHGVFLQRGGTVNATKNFIIGYALDSSGAYVMTGGAFNITTQVANLANSGSAKGLWEISGGTATAAKGVMIASAGGNVGTLRLTGSGSLVTAHITSGAGTATVAFDGGTVKATDVNEAFFNGLTNIVLKAGGVALDTQGHGLGITNCTFNVEPSGKMTVSGGGTVTFTDVTLNLSDPANGSAFVFAETDGVFEGAPSFSEKGWELRISPDRKTIRVARRGMIISFR